MSMNAMDAANWILLGPLAMVVLALLSWVLDGGDDGGDDGVSVEPHDDAQPSDQPTADGEPRVVTEAPIVYEMRLPTYSSALGLPSPAEVAAAAIDEWRGREAQDA